VQARNFLKKGAVRKLEIRIFFTEKLVRQCAIHIRGRQKGCLEKAERIVEMNLDRPGKRLAVPLAERRHDTTVLFEGRFLTLAGWSDGIADPAPSR
jgi:hypothetical protein